MRKASVSLRTFSGAYLRNRTLAAANRMLKGGVKRAREVIDGFLVDYTTVPKQRVAKISDTPLIIGYTGGYYVPSSPTPYYIGAPIFRLGRGRDVAVFPTTPEEPPLYKGIQTSAANPGVFVASTEILAVVPVGLMSYPARHWRTRFIIHGYTLAEIGTVVSLGNYPGPTIPYNKEVFSYVGIQSVNRGSGPLVRNELDTGFETDPDFPQGPAGAGVLVLRENFFDPNLGGPLARRDGMPWVLHFPFDGPTDNVMGWFVTAHTTASAQTEAKRMGISYVTSTYVADPVATGEPGAENNAVIDSTSLGFFDPLSFAAVSRPELIPASDPDYDAGQARYRYNHFQPAYVARVSPTEAAMVVRYTAQRGYPTNTDPLESYSTIKVVLMTASAVAGVIDFMVPASNADFGRNQDYWFVRGVGMDSDGETAVYIGMHPGFPDTGGPVDSRAGVIRVTNAGTTDSTFTALNFHPSISQVGASSIILNDAGNFGPGQYQPALDGVTYIGNGKFVCFVTPFANATYVTASDTYIFTEWDLGVATYDLGLDTFTLTGVVRHFVNGDFVHDFPPLDKSSHNVSRINVVVRETADNAAVLLASFGVSHAGSAAMDPVRAPGETWISYDSGVTWSKLADIGHGRGAFYAGGAAYDFDTETGSEFRGSGRNWPPVDS